MAGQLTHYEVLGVLPGASADDVRRAYEALMRALTPEAISGAPSKAIWAADRARAALEAARQILTNPVSRRQYDLDVGIVRTGGGLARPLSVPSEAGSVWDPASADGPDWDIGWLGRAAALVAPLAMLAEWLTPRSAQPRRVTVPDARGLFVGPARRLLFGVGLRADVAQLTPHPRPVEGLVIDQSPQAGARARASGTVTIQVWHPARRDGRTA